MLLLHLCLTAHLLFLYVYFCLCLSILDFYSWHHVDANVHIYWYDVNLWLCVYVYVHVFIYTVIVNSSRLHTWSVPDLSYRLCRLKSRGSKARGPLAKVHNIFNTVIGLSYTCCHSHNHLINTSQTIKFVSSWFFVNITVNLQFYFPKNPYLFYKMFTKFCYCSALLNLVPHKWNSLGSLFI